MRVARSLVLVALLPLFAACQLFDGPRESASHVGQTRMQGQLTAADGKLMFQPCNEQRSLVVNDTGGTSVLQEAASLADDQGKLFADVRGRINGSSLDLEQLYRVERSGTACDDPNFKLLILRAAGHGPEWNVKVSGKGMASTVPASHRWRCPTLKNNWAMAASISAAKPMASTSNCGSRPIAASTAAPAASST